MPIGDEVDLAKMLADGRITALTIDTNIFDEKGLQFNNASLQAIVGLKNRRFKFVLSGTVEREVRGHLQAKMEKTLKTAQKSIASALHAFEIKEALIEKLLDQISGGRTGTEAANDQFDAYIAATGCHLLDDMKYVGTETIFRAYFEGKPPFGSGAKKNEFPDALALNALEFEAASESTGILVVSRDTDWRAYCEASARLYHLPEIERALSLIASPPTFLREAVLTWLAAENEGRSSVRSRLTPIVERMDCSIGAEAVAGELEILQWDAELVDIEWPTDEDIDIIDVELANDNTEVKTIISLPLKLHVRVPVELNFSVWDGIDRESISLGSRMVEAKKSLDVHSTLKLDFYDMGTEDEYVELVGVEIDEHFLEIDLGSVEVFEQEDEWPEQ